MADKHLRLPAVMNTTGLARSTIYALIAKGEFPRGVKLTGKAIAWPESRITEWLQSRSEA